MKDLFANTLDTKHTGQLDSRALLLAFRESGLDISDKEVNAILLNGQGTLRYTDFLIATLEVKPYLTEQMMRALFRYFDCDQSGRITERDMRQAMAKTGKTLMVRGGVEGLKEGIGYEEFAEMMRRTAEKGDEHILTSG